MDISFRNSDSDRQTLFYEKVQWDIGGEKLGLRYGENPDQPAAMYKLINGNLAIGGVETVLQGRYLASDVELLQSGKHPGKINLSCFGIIFRRDTMLLSGCFGGLPPYQGKVRNSVQAQLS